VIGQATDDGPSPEIGDGVTISAGAKVFGGISIGRQAVIGANAVVNEDIPDFAVAVGVPARVVKVQGVRTDGRVSSSPR
jgi:serine O-acetyltransferase